MRLTELNGVFFRSAAYERRFLSNNPWDLAMVVWIPLAAVLLIWWTFSQTQITNLPIGVIDRDNGPIANTAVRYLDVSPTLKVKQLYASESAAKAAILQRDVYAVVVIPAEFSLDVLSGKPAPLVLQVNAQYGTHSGIIQTGVQSVAGTLSAGIEIQRLVKQGMAPSQAMIAYSPIGIQRISLFNNATNYQQFLASTVIPALLHILAMVVGATTIGRELRDKSIGHWYDAISPVTDPKAPKTETPPVHAGMVWVGLLGKYFWPLMAYSLWSMVAVWLATPQDSITLGSVMTTYIGLLLLMMLSFFIGAVLTLNTFSLRMGLSATGFISAPSYAFAGVTFPYVAISENAQHWSDILPLTHYLKLHIAQLQMQAPAAVSLPIVYGLTLATILAMLLTTLLTKRALAHPERWGAR